MSKWAKTRVPSDVPGAGERKVENQFKVLIVEDNDFNIVPIKATLQKHMIDFDVAENGFMAVDRYTQIMRDGYPSLMITHDRVGTDTA